MSTFLPGSYLTIDEYRAAPTALQTNNLVPGKDEETQDEELAAIIKRASTFIDNTARQKLFATRATQNERVRTNREGFFVLHAHQDRVKSVDKFAFGASPTSLSAMTEPIPPSQYFIEENRILFSRATGGALSWVGGLNFIAAPANGEFYVSWTYTAGWVTTRLDTDAAIGATQITVEDPAGVEPGEFLQLINATDQTTVQVDTAYTRGSTTVPLTAPLTQLWPAGTGFTEVEQDIKEAAILATTHYIKMRKAGGFVMAGASATVDSSTELDLGPELEQARLLALRFERRSP